MNEVLRAGSLICMLLAGCSGGAGSSDPVLSSAPGDLPRSDIRDLDALYAFKPDSLFAADLQPCAVVQNSDDACTLQRLPVIGLAGGKVSRSSVMDRVLVTHAWMGERFEQVLEQAPDDLISLFAPVSVISIGSTVRPSSYRVGTASIRLDPRYLWMSIDEKSTVSVEEDFRSGYGADLNFWSMQRSVIDGQRAYPASSLTSYQERSLNDLLIPVLSLLYHELGHAVDYLHPDFISSLDVSLPPEAAIKAAGIERRSTLLSQISPLQSIPMDYLALVQFRGYVATEQQKMYTPADVGAFMNTEGAMKYYSYHTEREDFANLLQYTMMKKNFDIDFVMAFVTRPSDENNVECADLKLGWGQHNRLSDPFVLPRAEYVFDSVFGENIENRAFFEQLPNQQRAMSTALNWCENLVSTNSGIHTQDFKGAPLMQTAQQRLELLDERRVAHH